MTRATPIQTAFRALVLACCFLACCQLLAISALGQTATATLSGTVEDENGALIPNAALTAINTGTAMQRDTTTDDRGNYVFVLLPPGTYIVRVQAQGFATVENSNVILNVGDQKSLRIQLKAGNISEMVKVSADAPLINESPAVGTVVDRQFVENMPLNGRSFQSLIALTPGVVLTKATVGEQGQFSVNGQRASANYFMIDGVGANAGVTANFSLGQTTDGALPAFGATGGTNGLVAVDAMQEFKIQTSTYAPEFGRTPGAQISIATRSGTNEFHGTLFEYFRNNVLDANDWFNNARRLAQPALRQNDFGGVLGGPLYLPRFGEGGPSFYSGKNRTFFFFSYEGLRLRLPQTQITIVPSSASRNAPTTVASIQPFLNAYPVPNGRVFANDLAEFVATYSDPSSLDATSIRLDHKFSDRLTLFGRYNYSLSKATERGLRAAGLSLNSVSQTEFDIQALTLGATQSFNSSISNEIRFNYTRSKGSNLFSVDNFGGAVPVPDSNFLPSSFTSANSALIFQIGGAQSIFGGKNATNIQRQFNLVNNLSVVTRSHQLKFGIDYRLLLPTNGVREYGQTVFFSDMPAAITGIAGTVTVDAREIVLLSAANFSAYAQDTWKTNRRLTLTYGIRWDVNPAQKGRNGKDLFSVENLNDLASLALAPRGTSLYKTTYNNFAPRVGAAYQLSQKQGREIVLRGGFGVFYDLGSGALGNAASSFPYARSASFSNVAFPLTAAQAVPPPFSLSIPASGNITVSDRNLKLPRTYQWNAGIEQSLGADQTLSATYVGAIGRRLLRRTSRLRAPSLFILNTDNSATSDYHALQLQFQRRLSRNLQALASYTWSHSIDIASTDSASGSTPTAPKLDRGNSDFDVRHSFNAALNYDIKSSVSGKVLKAILNDWSIDSILTARSATPVNLAARNDFTGGIQTAVRPNLIPGVALYIDDSAVAGGRRFNNVAPTAAQVAAAGCAPITSTNAKGAFCTPPAGRQGNFGRNILRGFPAFQIDMALRRQFNLTEKIKLQLRAEAFNIFNHPNFGDPSGSLTSALFGQSTVMLGRSLGSGGVGGGFNPLYQIGGPRSIQLALKVQF